MKAQGLVQEVGLCINSIPLLECPLFIVYVRAPCACLGACVHIFGRRVDICGCALSNSFGGFAKGTTQVPCMIIMGKLCVS